MKRTYEAEDDEPRKKLRGVISYDRGEIGSVFQSLWSFEKLRCLLAFHGLCNTGLVIDVVMRIMLDFLHVSTNTQIRCRATEDSVVRYTRCYDKNENPILFKQAMDEYRRIQRRAIRDSRDALLAKGTPFVYIHVVSANVSGDGLGGVYPYDESIFDGMERLYIPFLVMYICVDIRDTLTIRRYLPNIKDDELHALIHNAVRLHNRRRDDEDTSFWGKLKSLLFDDMEMLGK